MTGLSDGAAHARGGPLRIGLIGCGNIVTGHLHGLAALQAHGFDGFRLTALCDAVAERAERYRQRGEGPPQPEPKGLPWDESPIYASDLHDDVETAIFTDWRQLLDAGAVDAVFVLAPIFLHHEIGLAFLDAGVHVLMEKPLAISVRAGRLLVDRAAARGLQLGVAESMRYFPTSRGQRLAIDSGRIGSVNLSVSAVVAAHGDAVFDGTPWRHVKRLAGGGFALDAGVHRFHQLRYLCGEIDELYGMTARTEARRFLRAADGTVLHELDSELEDVYFAQLRYRSGAIGSLVEGLAGRGAPIATPAIPAIYGTSGCVLGDDVIGPDGQRERCVDLLDSDLAVPRREEWFPGGLRDPFALEQLAFFRAVSSGVPMETSGADALVDLACSFAVLESSASHQPVRVDDVLAGRVDAYQAPVDELVGLQT